MRLRYASIISLFTVAAASILVLAPYVVRAADAPPTVTFDNGRIRPESVTVAAGRAFHLKVVNAGSSTIEFESFELNRERVVAPGQTVTVYIPALNPGSYAFVDDFHPKSGKGLIITH